MNTSDRQPRVHVVTAAADFIAPQSIDAVVEEQDTHLLLSSDTKVAETAESYRRLLGLAVEQTPRPPGTAFVITRETPARILAIVHDLDLEPSWREEWVATACTQIFSAIQAYGFRSVAMPLLGTVHGRLNAARSAELLRQALTGTLFLNLQDLLVIAPARVGPVLLATPGEDTRAPRLRQGQ